jgi:carboxyl-terminal processing protease
VRETLRLAACAVLLAVSVSAYATVDPAEPLHLSDKQPSVARNVTKLIEELHYSRPTLDNSLSSAILDRYLDMLDGNRMYFLASDIASFGRYRYELDDRAKSGELEPVFDIFNRFRDRTRERINYALSLLETEPDFTVDESFRFDRSDLGWPLSQEDMQEVWRQKVKSDAVSLMLTGQTWEEAVDVLKQRYEQLYKRVSQLDGDDVFETFMNAVAHTMDPHSSYLSPRQSEEYRIQMSLSYDGIGASLQTEDDYVKIVDIIPGGPAQIDGQLKPEDRITAVAQGADGKFVDVIGWRLDDVVDMIRGPGGTTVRLRVLPAGAAPGSTNKVIGLVRDKIKLEEQAAKADMKDVPFDGRTYKIGVITVPSFYQDFAARSRGEKDYTSTSRDVARLIGELQQKGMDGLVLDLRENGGGHLSEATELSGLFIDRGPVVQLRETRGNVEVLQDPSPDALYDGPLAVLVDRYSASASEIFAGAIQDYHRGVIVGQQTFGKGSVQNLFNLDRVMRGSDNGQLTLTIGKYYRVTGASTQNRGVIPDIKLPSMVDVNTVGENTRDTALPWDTIEPTQFKPDPSLDGAISTLLNHQLAREADDPDFDYLVDDVKAFEKVRDEKSVSLNLEARKAERDEQEQDQLGRENKRRAALGLEPLASIEDLDSAETPEEIQLNETTRMVAEMVELKNGNNGESRRLISSGSESAALGR